MKTPALFLAACLALASSSGVAGAAPCDALQAKVLAVRAELRSEAELLDEGPSRGWWNLVERRRRDMRLRRLRALSRQKEELEAELGQCLEKEASAGSKKP